MRTLNPDSAGPRPRRLRGVSLLELLVTLVIVGLVVSAVVHLLYSTERNTIFLRRHLDKLARIQFCLDRIIEDLASAAVVKARLDIKEDFLTDGRQTSHLLIIAEDTAAKVKDIRRVEWIAVPRYEQQDLVLFRREQNTGSGRADYIPMCENLSTFRVQKLDDNGQPVYDAPASLLEISAQVFLEGPRHPDRVFTVTRTFCLDRFQL